MSLHSSAVTVQLEYSRSDCLSAAKSAIEGIRKFKLKEENEKLGILQVSIAPGLTSTTWGDTMTITFSDNATGGTVLSVASTAKFASVAAGSQQSKNISTFMNAFESEIQEYTKIDAAASPAANTVCADELLKLKNLLDMGILTQEEFNAKKKQLLNL